MCHPHSPRDAIASLLTVGGEQEVGSILLRKPFDLVDLLLDLQTLQIVELRLVALECAVNIILPPTLRLTLTLRWKGEKIKNTTRVTCLLFTLDD